MWSLYPNIFSMTFSAKEQKKLNNSIWLILYTKHLIENAWSGLTVHYVLIVVLKLIYYFTVLNCGPNRSVSPAVLRLPEHFMRSVYAKITLLEIDFTRPERKRLNRGAVPCSSDSASQYPTPQLPGSALTDLNSLLSLLSAQKNLHVQAPSRTYGKLPVSSSSIQTPLSILEDSPCTSSKICAVKSTPAASMFAVEDNSCPLALKASAEFRCINHPNRSSKPRARHSLLRELNLATVFQLKQGKNCVMVGFGRRRVRCVN